MNHAMLSAGSQIQTVQDRAMGTSVNIQVDGSDQLAAKALKRIRALEQRWSRFLPDSDISRCNQSRGFPVSVHSDTRTLVRHGLRAWELTDGALDPTVLDAVIAAGYDRSFEQLDLVGSKPLDGLPAPGCAGIEVDDFFGTVALPAGGGFDPGAIGKGLAADLVVSDLIDSGVRSAFVSIGGDIRVEGVPPQGDGWLVEIREPTAADGVIGRVSVTGGGLATSTNRRRRWTVGGHDRHHIIDPRSGLCATGEAVLVTAIAGEAWWAEALATQLMLSEPAEWENVVGDNGALIVDRVGAIHVVGQMNEHLQ